MLKIISDALIKVLKEFGVIGVITYAAGLISLGNFLWNDKFNEQVLFGVIGVLLFGISGFIASIRIKAQSYREKSLIEMVQNSSNRLAERLNENVQKDQAVSITQTIWQTQKDLIKAILKGDSNINQENENSEARN